MIAGSLALGLARLGYASEAGAAASSTRGLVGHAPRTAPERAAHAGLLLQLGRTAEAETEARSAVFFLAPHGSDNAKDQLNHWSTASTGWAAPNLWAAESYQHLAEALWARGGRTSEVEVALRAALAGSEGSRGHGHPSTLQIVRHLAVLLKQTRGLSGPTSASEEVVALLRRAAVGLPLALGTDYRDAQRAELNLRNLQKLIPVPAPSPPPGCGNGGGGRVAVWQETSPIPDCAGTHCSWEDGFLHYGPNRAEFLVATNLSLPEAFHTCAHEALLKFPDARFLNFWPKDSRCVVKGDSATVVKRLLDLDAEGGPAFTCDLATSTWPDDTSTMECGSVSRRNDAGHEAQARKLHAADVSEAQKGRYLYF